MYIDVWTKYGGSRLHGENLRWIQQSQPDHENEVTNADKPVWFMFNVWIKCCKPGLYGW